MSVCSRHYHMYHIKKTICKTIRITLLRTNMDVKTMKDSDLFSILARILVHDKFFSFMYADHTAASI